MPPSSPINSGATNRDINVTLRMKADTAQGSKAVQDLRRETERLEQSTKRAQQEMNRIHGGRGGGPPTTVSQPGFFGGGLGLGIGIFAAERALAALGNAIDAFSKKVGSNSQKVGAALEAFFDTIPGVSTIVNIGKGFGKQALFGHSIRALEESQRNIARDTALGGLQRQRDLQLDNLSLTRLGPRVNYDAISSFYSQQNYSNLINDRFSGFGTFNRIFGGRELGNLTRGTQAVLSPLISGIGGLGNFGMGFRNMVTDPRILGAEQGASLLRLGLDAPQTELGNLERLGTGYQSGANRLRDQIQMMKRIGPQATPLDPLKQQLLEGFFGPLAPSNPNEFDKTRFNQELSAKEAEFARMREQLERNITDQYSKRKEIAERTYQIGKAELDVLKARSTVLTEQLRTQQSGAISAGLMSGDERQNLLFILQETQRMGFANAPEEYRKLLASNPLTAQYAQREAYNFGAQDPTFLKIQELVGAEKITDLERQIQDLQKQIVEKNAKNEIDRAKALDNAAQVFGQQMAKLIEEYFKIALDAAERQLKLGNKAAQPAP